MTQYQTLITFAGQPCCDPAVALEQMRAAGEDTSWWEGKANVFRHVRGKQASNGWVLLTGKYLDLININLLTHSLVFTEGTTTVTIAGLSIVRADAISPGPAADANTLYLVEIADRRIFGGMTSGFSHGTAVAYRSRAFNMRLGHRKKSGATTTKNYLYNSMEAGPVLFTWSTMFSRLWFSLTSSGSGQDSIWGDWQEGAGQDVDISTAVFPTYMPENLDFAGVSSWDAINWILDHIGHAIVRKINGTFKIVPVGITDAATTATLGTAAARALYYSYSRLGAPVHVPEKVEVCFPYHGTFIRDTTSNEDSDFDWWTARPYYRLEIGTSSISGFSSISTATHTAAHVLDSMSAVYDEKTPSSASATTPLDKAENNSDLLTRAQELAERWLRKNFNIVYPGATHNTYSALHAFECGPLISAVVWHDTGDGIKTDVIFHPRELDMTSAAVRLKPEQSYACDNEAPPDIARPRLRDPQIVPMQMSSLALMPHGTSAVNTVFANLNWNAGTTRIETGDLGDVANDARDALGQFLIPSQKFHGIYVPQMACWLSLSAAQIHYGIVSRGWRAVGSGPTFNTPTSATAAWNIEVYLDGTNTATVWIPSVSPTYGHPNVIAGDIVAFAVSSFHISATDAAFVCLSDVMDDAIGTVKMMTGATAPRGWARMDGTANAAGSGIDLRDNFIKANTTGGSSPYDPGGISYTAGISTYTPNTFAWTSLYFVERLDNHE